MSFFERSVSLQVDKLDVPNKTTILDQAKQVVDLIQPQLKECRLKYNFNYANGMFASFAAEEDFQDNYSHYQGEMVSHNYQIDIWYPNGDAYYTCSVMFLLQEKSITVKCGGGTSVQVDNIVHALVEFLKEYYRDKTPIVRVEPTQAEAQRQENQDANKAKVEIKWNRIMLIAQVVVGILTILASLFINKG